MSNRRELMANAALRRLNGVVEEEPILLKQVVLIEDNNYDLIITEFMIIMNFS